MMVKVALKQLRYTWRVWVGTLVMVIVASTGITAVCLHLATANTLEPEQSRAILSLANGEMAFLVVASLAMLASTAHYAIAATRAGYARLQLVGVLPRQVFTIVLVQLFAVGVIGVCLGTLIGVLCAQPTLDYTVAQTSLQLPIAAVYPGVSLLLSALVVLAVTLISGVRSARSASMMPVLRALRETDEVTSIRLSRGRLVLALILLGCAAALMAGMQSVRIGAQQERVGMDISTVMGLGVLLGLCLISLLASLAPFLATIFIGAWSALVPMRFSVSWRVARRFVQYSGGRSAATLTPVLVAVGLPGILYTVFYTVAAGMSIKDTRINTGGLSVILAPVLLTATLGAAAIILMASMSRNRDFALLALTGASRVTVLRIVIFESLMYAFSSFLLALGVMAIVGMCVAGRFPAGAGVISTLGWDMTALAAGCAWIILCLANLAPVLRYHRLSLASSHTEMS